VTADHAVLLADIQRPIALFAQGLSGRFLHLLPIVDGGCSERHADSIELPSAIGDFESSTHNLGAYRIAVLRQIGYLTDGTLEFSLERIREQLALPSLHVRASTKLSDLNIFFALWSRPGLLRQIFLALEGGRVDAVIARRYPGAGADLDRVRARTLARRPQVSSLNALGAAVESLVRYALGSEGLGISGELLALADSAMAPNADVYGCACASVAICRMLDFHFHARALQVGPSAATAIDTAAADSEYFPSAQELSSLGLDLPGELIARMMTAHRRRGGQIGSLQSLTSPVMTSGVPDAATSDLKPSSTGSAATASTGAARPLAQNAVRSYLYDEWDYRGQTYLRAWCRLFEQRLQGEQFSFIDDVRRRHALLAQQIRRQFSLIRPELWHRVRRSNDGDELELDAVIDAVIDRRSAGASDSQLYIRRDRALRDVAAAFLMDMSASTGFPLPGAQSAAPTPKLAAEYTPYLYGGVDDMAPQAPESKRRVIDVAKDALALMCEALQRLGDNCAIYGFSGDGRERVEFHVAKDFDDRLSVRTWAALAAMEPLRSTRMGPAIRHALTKLRREPSRVKALIIVSDGYPQDHDYGPDRKDDNYGIEDTACALREAERDAVSAFCVTIDPAGHDYLRRMCASSRYMVIDDVMALPRELTKIYRTLTASR
jgi:nitric oxide reductase NorD protein